MAPKYVQQFKQGHECDRQPGDGWTDHAMVKCVEIVVVICAVLTNNTQQYTSNSNIRDKKFEQSS